jgi:phenylacetate-CoA ligase
MTLRDTVKRLPYPIQQSIRYVYSLIPPRIRYGRVFWETYNFLQESQWWSKERLEDYQMQQLNKLLKHAYENVPYYRRVFDERGLKPKDIQSLNDFKKLPYLDKNTFKLHAQDMIARNFSLKKLHMSHTSGTTGKPLQFYQDDFAAQREWAFIHHQWSRVGYKPGDARVEFRGAVNRSNPVYYDPVSKVLRLSPLVDSKETAIYYMEKIESFGSQFLHGYPGAIASFANAIKQFKLIVPFQLKAVLFASEAVYEWEREIVREVFNCRIYSHYGMAEKVVLAAECEYSDHYHCLPQYGITEIDPNTREIIGTGFLNYANPFIRYRTTDIASLPVFTKCEKCGRNYYPVFAKVEGRLEDFIITPKGALIAPAIITHPFKDLKTIKDTQVVQESLGCVTLKAVPWDKSNMELLKLELKTLCGDLQSILGDEMQIKSEIVDEVQHPKSGKFKWVISNISRDSLEKGIH